MAEKPKVLPEALFDRWMMTDIGAIIRDYGALCDKQALLTRLRGSIGRAMMDAASDASLAHRPCDWSPPCANDLFFGAKPKVSEPMRLQTYPKPFVVIADRRGADLLVRLRVFGFAQEWLHEIRPAFVTALRKYMPWDVMGRDVFLPKSFDLDITVSPVSPVLLSPVPKQACLSFVTPLDGKNLDPLERPYAVLSAMIDRFRALALWHEHDVMLDVKSLASSVRALDYRFDYIKPVTILRHSRRSGDQDFRVPGTLFDLWVDGDLSGIWPVLSAVTYIGTGRATSFGFGRFDVVI